MAESRHPVPAPPLDYASASTGDPSARPHSIAERALAAVLLLGTTGVVAAVLFGPLNARRDGVPTPNACASNLRSIEHAIQMYANDHAGAFPSTFGDLYPAGGAVSPYAPDVRIFLCPYDPACLAAYKSGAAKLEADLLAGRQHSYVYVGAGLRRPVPGDAVIAYCVHHPRHRSVILFADGHTETAADIRPVLDQLAADVRPVRLPVRAW